MLKRIYRQPWTIVNKKVGLWYNSVMDTNALANMETLYLALADKTRLRLLNLMRANEVCVCFFTEVLGESQPKVSRHLAYLRNAGLVDARRDGKWMHYSIVWPEDAAAAKVLNAALDWITDFPFSNEDLNKYEKVCCTPELLVQVARTPIDFIEHQVNVKTSERPEIFTPTHVRSEGHNELEEFLL